MGLNHALVGKTYTQSNAVLIEAEAAIAYARATNASNPAYFSTPSIIHPMFGVSFSFASLTAPLMDGELQADLMRLVHGEQKMVWHRMLNAGETIQSTSLIKDIATKDSGETIVIAINSMDENGDLVLEIESTLFIRGRSKTKKNTSGADAFSLLEPFYVSDQSVDEDQSVRYAEASGDRNPIHLDDDAAQLAGLPGRILHGLCSMAFVHNSLVEKHDHDPARIKELSVRFSRPIFMGDRLTIDVRQQDTTRGAESKFAIRVTNQDGQFVLTNGFARCG